ncbi:RNA polymerase sigma-70 factor, ECF subfamily [Pararobbsia alpina]|uniref:sigma-70 family RNA polymerase sigma factor n=1 Tax=Pararobbsia alpina TaxID=621374 RepID=UPI0039A4821A
MSERPIDEGSIDTRSTDEPSGDGRFTVEPRNDEQPSGEWLNEPHAEKTASDPTTAFEASRRRLLSLAYRMLGSRAEAEDIVQETWLRWNAGTHDDLRTPAAWLTTVATRLAIDRLRVLQREREQQAAPFIPEPWLDEWAPSSESIIERASDLTYGLMLMYERLSPEERAALLLYEAFDCGYDEIAQVLSKQEAACRQLVHRAKRRIREQSRRTSEVQPARHFIDRLVDAIANQDKVSLIGMMLDELCVVGDTTGMPVTVDEGKEAANDRLISNSASLTLLPPLEQKRANADLVEALTEKTGPFEIATKRASAHAVVNAWVKWTSAGGTVEPFALNGRRGVAFLDGCRIVMAIGFSLRAGRLASCIVLGEHTLHVLNETYDPIRVLNEMFERGESAMCSTFLASAVH